MHPRVKVDGASHSQNMVLIMNQYNDNNQQSTHRMFIIYLSPKKGTVHVGGGSVWPDRTDRSPRASTTGPLATGLAGNTPPTPGNITVFLEKWNNTLHEHQFLNSPKWSLCLLFWKPSLLQSSLVPRLKYDGGKVSCEWSGSTTSGFKELERSARNLSHCQVDLVLKWLLAFQSKSSSNVCI